MSQPEFGEIEWKERRAEIAASKSLFELQKTMALTASQMAKFAQDACEAEGSRDKRRLDQTFWKHLGVSVIKSDLTHSGGHYEEGGTRLIFVSASEHRLRQRFTAAHEIGHFLLDDLRGNTTLLDSENEELICDDFASELLIPIAELNSVLSDNCELTLELLMILCRQFRVNLQPMLIALARSGRFNNYNAFLTRRRGHPNRPSEIDYRVEKCPFRSHIFLPKNQRLRSLGLACVVDWAIGRVAGKRSSGQTDVVELPLRERGRRSGIAKGPAQWQAQTLSKNELLVIVEISKLTFQWNILKKKV